MMKQASISEPFRVPLGFGPLPGSRIPGIIRNPWPQPSAAGRVHGWCCQCVDTISFEAWVEEAAPFILLESEWRVWRHLPNAATRRRWLRGRVAAKDAVRLLLLERFNIVSPLEMIGILPDEHGQPQVSCKALPETGSEASISISHCGNSSVALASERSEFCRGVGIDVASQTDNHDGLAEGGFIDAETALLDNYPALERADWLLRLWCAKEAVGKALGVGLMGNPFNYIVRHVDHAEGEVEVEITIPPKFTALFHRQMRLTARVGSDRGMTFAVAHREDN